MTQSKSSDVAAEPISWAPIPEALTGAVGPSASVADEGRVRLGGQAPMFLPETIADKGRVRLGGQAPMFLPEIIADEGLVRLGGQSPIF